MSWPSLDRGTAVRIEADIRNAAGTLANPDTITCQIFNPSGATYLAQTAMTNSSAGVFLIDVQTSESDPSGLYSVTIRATLNSLTTLLNDQAFRLD